MLNKINHKPQSHAKVWNEDEENKEKNDWPLFFKPKRSILSSDHG